MSTEAIKKTVAPDGGMIYTNESGVELYVIVREGPETPEAVQQGWLVTSKFLLKPGESRTVAKSSTESRVSVSTDTSASYGKVNLVGGCGTGCTHDPGA